MIISKIKVFIFIFIILSIIRHDILKIKIYNYLFSLNYVLTTCEKLDNLLIKYLEFIIYLSS